MPPLLLGLTTAAILLVILAMFFLASRSEQAGNGLIRLSRLINILGWASLHAANACKSACGKTLPHSLRTAEDGAGDIDTHSLVVYVIARLLYLLIALAVFLGDFPLTRLRGAALFGIPVANRGNLPLDIVNGLLWIAVPILCWAAAWDLWEQMPESWRLLPRLKLNPNRWLKVPQIGFRILFATASLAFLILAIIVSAYFLLWGQLQISGFDATQLGLSVSLGFGLLVYFAAGVAFIALIGGCIGLATIVLGILYCVLTVVAVGLGLLGHSLETSANSQPQPISPSLPFMQPRQQPAPAYTLGSSLHAGNNLLLPEGRRGIEPPQEDLMTDRQREQVVSLINLGNFGFRFASPFTIACEEVGSQRLIRQQAVIDLSRPKGGILRPSSQSIHDITPYMLIDELISARIPPEQAYARIMHSIVMSMVDSFTHVPVIKGYIVIALDLSLLPHITESLEDLHRLLPSHSILLVSVLSERLLQDKDIDETFESLWTLWEERVIQNTLFIHDRSQVARRIGEEMQEKFRAKALASLLACHLHSTYNPTFGEVVEQCSSLSPFTTLSFASAKVAPGKSTPGQRLVNALRPGEPAKGKGDLNNCISQTIHLFQEVCKPRYAAMADQGTIGDPLFFLLDEPIPLSDQRFREYRNAAQQQMVQTHPQANLIVVRGSGTPESKENPGYYIQCTALRPLTLSRPDMAQEISTETSLTHELVQPETAPAQTNGRRKQQTTL